MLSIRLAPMCGVTDHIFRSLCFDYGCDSACTEMVSAMGYLCAPNQRAVKEIMKRGTNEKKLVLQLFGKEPALIAEAAHIISDLDIYDGIDINMGCPARKVACSGEGCGLMKNPEAACRIMKETVRSSRVPVSVKLRLGWDKDHINVVDFARMAEDSGISEITVHGRTREQQYSGNADWDLIGLVKQKVHIPVIGNGDIFSAADAIKRGKESGVDGIAVGRGALGNPWIFLQIKDMLSGNHAMIVLPDDRRQMIRRHYSLMLENKPKEIATREMRKHIGWYLHGMRGAAKIRDEINRCQDPAVVLSIVDRYLETADSTSSGD